ncbi:hypothetical protein GGQ68_004365 [Sagittula marina]|uniref:Integrase catalytic domain-containing protein n=1 Tax=Sagittula marina TaxID=943940 RepID=A0A7W6DRS6_9RHOB|nr:hypothetical protein [Sagittula marina]MBB3988011.1 hypothetical protein [Sagittula marina]
MTYFARLKATDRVTFEGAEVTRTSEVRDRGSEVVTHYLLSVLNADHDVDIRKFRADEIPHLLESELLIIERGYYSPAQQMDRAMFGTGEMFGATRKRRARIDLIMFLCTRMAHYRKFGMILTRDGVQTWRAKLDRDYKSYQARRDYGTETANATQSLKPLPRNDTLLSYYRKFRKGGQQAKVFCPPRARSVDLDEQAIEDQNFVLRFLRQYPDKPDSKSDVAAHTVSQVEKENERRRAAGYPVLIDVKSTRTYERWIDKYLDRFTVTVKREGLAKAKAELRSVEQGLKASFPGQSVVFDAWQVHVLSLNVSRAAWDRMTPEQRAKVKRVRRWVVVAIDVATRMILGFAFCAAPNQEASLSCLRMCFVDKTPLLREAGLFESSWDNRAPIHMVSTDSGSEFGKNPFGGSRFVEAVRILSGSLLNAVTGVAELRAHVERLFRTFELKWARHLPGWTAGAPHLRNDRNPGREACLTDDDLHRLFVTFVADYNASPHRGLGGATPSGTWAKLSKHEQFDPFALPGSQALREACGSSHAAGVSEAGIRFEGLVYSNEFIRNQRKAPGVDRIARPGEKLEIIVDPMNLGAISVVANGDLISVPCLDETMRGKSLAWWKAERTRRKAEAALDVADHSKAQSEARESWRGEAKAIAHSAGVTMEGRSDEEAARLRKELEFGKGAHEKPFVGRDEFIDPLQTGYATGPSGNHTASAPRSPSETEAAERPDGANPLDRFRSNGARRRPRS